MNILLINHYAGSPNHGMEFRPYYMAREWIKLGHHVTIVGASFSHLRRNQPDMEKSFTIQNLDGIDYIWLKTNKYEGNGLKRVFSFFYFMLRLFYHGKRIRSFAKPDCVIASSTYPLDIFPARFIANKSRAKLCFEVHDLWPLTLILLGGHSPKNPLIRLIQYAENYAYKHSDRVVSMLGNAKSHMVEHGLDEVKYLCVPNGYFEEDREEKLPVPEEHLVYISSLKDQGKILIGYAGGHSVSNALSTVIEVAEMLIDNEDLAFILVGEGIEKPQLMKDAQTRGLDNVHFLSRVSKRCIPELLSTFDVLYLGWSNSPLYKYGISPNKLIDYMLAAKPIVHAVCTKGDLVQLTGCGFSVPSDRKELIVGAIEKACALDTQTKLEIGNRGRAYAIQNLNYTILASKFINALFEPDIK